jgi:prophage regulatory protein
MGNSFNGFRNGFICFSRRALHNLCGSFNELKRKTDMQVARLPAVEAKTGIKKTKIYKLMREGKFPPCIKLGGGRAVGWLETDLNEWIQHQIDVTASAGK